MKATTGIVKTSSNRVFIVFAHVVLILLAFTCLYPFLIILGSSFQSENEIMTRGYAVLPQQPTLEAYKIIMGNPQSLLTSYGVTILTTLATTLLGLAVVSTFGYVVARKDYPYRRALSFFAFFTMLFNGGMVPSYILISNWLGLKDNLLALILPLVCSAWYILMMKGFFQTIPTALIESAKIDGAGELRIFLTIVVPISKPAFATIGLFYVLAAWNDWWLSLLYIENESLFKLQYLLMKVLNNIEFLNSYDAIKYGVVNGSTQLPTYSVRMAMCILAAGPILVVFPFFQKYFVRGITVGAVKG